MKKDIAKKWVRALRSKKYRQCRGVLKTKNVSGKTSHCCLGVLCELYQQERKKLGKKPLDAAEFSNDGCHGLPRTNRIFEFGGTSLTLPAAVMRWAGVENDDGSFRRDFCVERGRDNFRGLAAMNDNGCRFSTIADTIEQYVKLI